MKASNLVKTLIASTLLSATFVAGSAVADGGYGYYGNPGRTSAYQANERFDYRYNDARTMRYVDQMQAQQRARIEQGIRSGELTQKEAARLLAEQRNIERMQSKYMADARLAPKERQRLMNELEDASRNIWREKHDAQERNDFRPPWYAYR